MMGTVTVATEMTWRTLNIFSFDATAEFCQPATAPSIRSLSCHYGQQN